MAVTRRWSTLGSGRKELMCWALRKLLQMTSLPASIQFHLIGVNLWTISMSVWVPPEELRNEEYGAMVGIFFL